jgi:hypothetical protein
MLSHIFLKSMLRPRVHFGNSFSLRKMSTIQSTFFDSIFELSRAGYTVNIPQIVLLGNQSSGKTSLLEGMCSIDDLFPKKAGLATQRPVYLYFNKLGDGEPSYVKVGKLGEKISNMDKARLRISEENNIDGISEEPLEVAVYSSKVFNCTVVDLPGYISTVRRDQGEDLPEKIRRINEKYINNDRNIKVLVMSATEDVALSLALKEVKRLGQLHNAVGVFTKIDLVTNDQIKTKQLEEILTDQSYTPFKCVGVKLRSTSDMNAKMTIADMILSEQLFIKKYELDKNSKIKVGLDILMRDISTEQIKRISDRLPEIRSQLSTMIDKKRYGNSVLDRLIQTVDMTVISEELDRIITEIHPESDLRIELEKKIYDKISVYVKTFIETEVKISDEMKTQFRVLQKPPGYHDSINLSAVRNSMVKNYNQIDPQILSKQLSYGLCKADVESGELERIRISNLNYSLIMAFYKLDKVSSYNKTQFIKNTQKIIANMISSKFSENIVAIVLGEIKDHILKNGESEDDIGKVFFVHIFDKICERANQDDLKRAITRMIIRERRLNIDYVKLTQKVHEILVSNGINIDIEKTIGLFGSENFPMGIEMYGPLMFKAYVHCLAEQVSNDSYRLTAENLLDPIITNAIKYSLDTVSKKDFTSEQEAVKAQINKLSAQLSSLDTVITETEKQKLKDQEDSKRLAEEREKEREHNFKKKSQFKFDKL